MTNKFIQEFVVKHYSWLSKVLFMFDVLIFVSKDEEPQHKVQLELNQKSLFFDNRQKEQRYYVIDIEQVRNKGENE
jgi:hypothetical protein